LTKLLQVNEADDIDYVDKPLLSNFQILYVCINGCRELQEMQTVYMVFWILYNGLLWVTNFVAVSRDPNWQMFLYK
jgi:hypothetical protein